MTTPPAKDDGPAVPAEALRALGVASTCLGDSLIAAYLHGSAVAGSLRPSSDIDLLLVTDRAMTREIRERLVAGLMTVSGRHPVDPEGRRCIEMIAFRRADLAALRYPARAEFVYGEWLRDAFEAGAVPEPESDPEFTLLLAQAKRDARALSGPDPAELLPIVPAGDIRRAIGDALPALLETLEGDERNVLLTLARMWRTLATGEFVPKDAAAEWAMRRLSPDAAGLLRKAKQAYEGVRTDGLRERREEVRRLAGDMAGRIAAMLSEEAGRLDALGAREERDGRTAETRPAFGRQSADREGLRR